MGRSVVRSKTEDTLRRGPKTHSFPRVEIVQEAAEGMGSVRDHGRMELEERDLPRRVVRWAGVVMVDGRLVSERRQAAGRSGVMWEAE